MRSFSLLLLVFASVGLSQTVGQEEKDKFSTDEKDWPKMARLLQLKASSDLSKLEKLQFEYVRATNKEVRARYIYWLRGVGDSNGLFGAIERYHQARIDFDGTPKAKALLNDKLELAKRIEKQAGGRLFQTKDRRSTTYSIDVTSAKAYRLKVELEMAKLEGDVD